MKFSIHRTPDGYYGTITVFTHPSSGVGDIVGADAGIQVGALGDTPADSLLHAASMIDHITSDPTVNALLPPQAQAAIQTIKMAAGAAKKGRAVAKKVFGFLHRKKKKKAAATVRKISNAQERAGGGFVNRLRDSAAARRASRMAPVHAPQGGDDYADDGYDDEPEAAEPEQQEPEQMTDDAGPAVDSDAPGGTDDEGDGDGAAE